MWILNLMFSYIQELDLVLDLTYSGGFQLAIDVDMMFGKSAYLSVKVTKMAGRARLCLTRLPYTHWSFAFVEVSCWNKVCLGWTRKWEKGGGAGEPWILMGDVFTGFLITVLIQELLNVLKDINLHFLFNIQPRNTVLITLPILLRRSNKGKQSVCCCCCNRMWRNSCDVFDCRNLSSSLRRSHSLMEDPFNNSLTSLLIRQTFWRQN